MALCLHSHVGRRSFPAARGLRRQQHSELRGERQGAMVAGAQPISAPCRSHSQPGRDREGLRRPGAAGAGRGDQRALARLLAVSERYPDLKSNQNFLALQSQLEGTENRIAVARRDYIEAVRQYNTELRTIPGRWIAAILYRDAKVKENFTAEAGAMAVPKVDFGKGT